MAKEVTMNCEYSFVLKRIWYDMIREGSKPIEYREISPYWLQRLFGEYQGKPYLPLKRLTKQEAKEYCDKGLPFLKDAIGIGKLRMRYNQAVFYHGYAADRPCFRKRITWIGIGTAIPHWVPRDTPSEKEFFSINLNNE